MGKKRTSRAISVQDVVEWGRQMGSDYGIQISYRLVPAHTEDNPHVQAYVVAYVDAPEVNPYHGSRALVPWPSVATRTLEGAFLRATHALDHVLYHKREGLKARTDELPF